MLDLTPLAPQIAEAGRRAQERRAQVAGEIALAATLAEGDSLAWAAQVPRIRAARTSWLVAHAGESAPGVRFAAPAVPAAHIVVATDGSQIAPDRHDGGLSACYVLNTSRIFLPYGTGARSRLEAQAEVVLLDEEADDEAERAAIAGLGMRRFAREIILLGELAGEAAATGLPAVALTDGSLIAWALEDETGKDAAKQEALAALLSALETAKTAGVPLVGYVSGPGSRDVVNALRITLCPEEPVDCRRCPHPEDALPCAPVRRATDAAVFARLLSVGERSPVFSAQAQATGFSRVLQMYGGAHWVAFFYLNVGAEIARIEFPAWVAEDAALVDRVHAVCLDQARKGRGYPVALAEAHERAVVRGADRQAFVSLLHRAMVQAGTPAASTRKALAKRTRAV